MGHKKNGNQQGFTNSTETIGSVGSMGNMTSGNTGTWQTANMGMNSSNQSGKSQSIQCAVTSCQYNQGASYCSLDQIQVNPCQNCNTGCAEDESNCSSYQQR